MKDEQIDKKEFINKCLIDCEHAHESIGGDFSRLAIYGYALVRLAKAHQTAGNLKAALGIYKKARAAFFIASCIKPSDIRWNRSAVYPSVQSFHRVRVL